MSDVVEATDARFDVSVMSTLGSSISSWAWASATCALASATATRRSFGSISARRSPCLTDWFSTTFTDVITPDTRGEMLLMSASMAASSVSSNWRS